MFSISAYVAGISLTAISAQTLTMIAGILAGSAGIVWFLRTKNREGYDSLETHTSQL